MITIDLLCRRIWIKYVVVQSKYVNRAYISQKGPGIVTLDDWESGEALKYYTSREI
jgi:hypothetical protein